MKNRNEYHKMTPDEIFAAAGRGQELMNLEPAEDALYSRARLIYDQFRHGELDAEQGAERRRMAMMKYEQALMHERFQTRLAFSMAQLRKEMEVAAANYIKEPGYRTANALWQSFTNAQAKIQIQELEPEDFFRDAEETDEAE